MMHTSKTILLTFACGFIFLIFACDDQPDVKKKPASTVVSGKISQPILQNKLQKKVKKDELNLKNNSMPKAKSEVKSDAQALEQKTGKEKGGHYNFQGKIDPFRPLIQDRADDSRSVADNRPKRILTPLEKVELSQIRLVAVIIMENKQIAMVEEANGKGYEIGIGTYIGKHQGRVTQIKKSSVVVKELVKDYKGKLREKVQEIKLHKIDNEE